MENFEAYLEGWRVFYGVVAGSSATLMGLIFLSVSLRLDLFKKLANKEPQQIAWQTFINFFWVFTGSLVFLLPGLTPLVLGLFILALGTSGEYISTHRWWRARNHLSASRGLIAFLPLNVCYLSLMVSGFLTIFDLYHAVVIMAPVTVFLIGISIRDAWRLLVTEDDYRK
jgi:hypothetical protein